MAPRIFFCFNILILVLILIYFFNIKPLRSMPVHFSCVYAVGIIGPSDSMHLPKLSEDESPLSPDVPLGLESKSMTQEVLITRRLRFKAQFL